jgi:CubicO group peptidase (beta-lactamase class C family)
MDDVAALRIENGVAAIFNGLDRSDRPGAAVGIMRSGRIVLRRGFGMASIEHGVPITPKTVFRIASVTKQFVAGGVVMLDREGVLSVDDPLSKWNDDLPQLGDHVTLAQLARNTSGLRDFLELSRLQGMDLERLMSAEELMAVIRGQAEMNFAPGSEFLYCNTGFNLLGKVIERATGKPLPEFLRERFFLPAGMSQTQLTPTTDTVVPNLATGYMGEPEDGYRQALHGYPLGGEGGLVSSLDDLLIWSRHYKQGFVGGAGFAERCLDAGTYSDGEPAEYAYGLFLGRYRGLRTISHGGQWPGFRTEFLVMPEIDLSVVVISNLGGFDPYAAGRRIVDVVLAADPPATPLRPIPKPPTREAAIARTGLYVAESGETLLIGLDRETPTVWSNGVPTVLLQEEDDLWESRSAFRRSFAFDDAGDLSTNLMGGPPRRFRRVAPIETLPDGLEGVYRSPEMDTIWRFERGPEGGLTVAVEGPIMRRAGWTVVPVQPDVFWVKNPLRWLPAMLDVRVVRADDGEILGLSVSGGRAKAVYFARLPDAS